MMQVAAGRRGAAEDQSEPHLRSSPPMMGILEAAHVASKIGQNSWLRDGEARLPQIVLPNSQASNIRPVTPAWEGYF